MPGLLSSFIAFAYAAASVQGYIVYPNGEIKRSITNPSCDFAVDIAQLIDVSWSQLDNTLQLKNDTQKILNFVGESGGRHRLALASFIDKPIAPLGWDLTTNGWIDYCFKLNIEFGQSAEQYVKSINNIYLAGGYDFPEGQLEALLRGSLTNELNWRTTSLDGLPVQKVLLIATDSIAHIEDDAKNAVNKLIENGNNDYNKPIINNLSTADLEQGGLNYGCQSFEYPSYNYVSQVLKSKNILPVFLVSPAIYECTTNPTGQCVWPEMIKLATSTGNQDYKDPQKGIQTYYKDLITKLQTVGVVIPMGIGFEGYGDALKQAVYEIGAIQCEATTTPTAPSTFTTIPITTASINTEISTTAIAVTTSEATTASIPTTDASTDADTTIPETVGSSEGCDEECQTSLVKIKLVNNCNGNVITDSYIV